MSTLVLPADCTHQTANACASLLKSGINRGDSAREPVVVDASAVQRFDSSAIAVLLDARREALAVGRSLQVLGAPSAMQRLMQVYGVGELFGPLRETLPA